MQDLNTYKEEDELHLHQCEYQPEPPWHCCSLWIETEKGPVPQPTPFLYCLVTLTVDTVNVASTVATSSPVLTSTLRLKILVSVSTSSTLRP